MLWQGLDFESGGMPWGKRLRHAADVITSFHLVGLLAIACNIVTLMLSGFARQELGFAGLQVSIDISVDTCST